MANFEGLLQSPWFNMGAGLLASDGRAEGLLTGMNQYNRNTRNAQAIQYQQAMMERMKEKAAEEERQKLLREQANKRFSTAPVGPEAYQQELPQIGQQQGPAYNFDQAKFDQLQGSPEYAQAYAQSQTPISEYQKQQLEIQRMNALKQSAAPTTNVYTGKFGEELGRGMAKNVVDQYDKMSGLRDSLVNINTAEGLLDSGMETGSLSNFKVGMGKLLQEAGINLNPEAIANTEAYTGLMARETAQIIKDFGAGTGLSDADREYALKAAAGDITFTEPSLRKLLGIRKNAIKNSLKLYNEKADQIKGKYTDLPYEISIEIPTFTNGESQNSGPQKISGQADFDKLPSGAKFIGPDGVSRVKP